MGKTYAATAADLDRLFPGTSEMARRMRSLDWISTPFGPPDLWPENLRMAVQLCLTSRFPILLWWGPQFAVLFNDACLPFLSERRRGWALARPGREVWSDVWETVGPILESVVATGVADWTDHAEFFFDRKLHREEVFVSFGCSPILAADGGRVDGIFCPCQEQTDKVIGARRLETLRKLGMRSTEARTIDATCRQAIDVLRENPRDIPFAALYVVTNGKLRLTASVPHEPDLPLPAIVSSAGHDCAWPLAQVMRTKRAMTWLDLKSNGLRIAGHWPELTRQAVVQPILSAAEDLAGLLVLGVSPRRPLDPEYRTFFELVVSRIATALSSARAHEVERGRAETLAELDRAKTPFGHVQACYEPLDLAALTAEAANAFRIAIERAGLRLTVACAPIDEPVCVDRSMWEKIVSNLVSNAIKFTRAGEIVVSLRRADASIELAVSDTGIGIAPGELTKIFDRFYRIEGARGRTDEGSGIGLALVHEFARLHGGTTRVESVEGRGSRFTIAIPRGTKHLPQDRIGARAAEVSVGTQASAYPAPPSGSLPHLALEGTRSHGPGAGRASREPRKRILVVDDDADLRSYLRGLLEVRHDVELACDGEAALAALRRSLPDLVLTGDIMPHLDGFELLAAMRTDERTRDVPAIVLSSRASEHGSIAGIELGAIDYLPKPFSARELLARIDACLEIVRLNRESLARERRLRLEAEEAAARILAEAGTELAAMTRLHQLSTRLLEEADSAPLLADMLDACIDLLEADSGTVQLYDAATGTLGIIAQRGFDREFLDYFARVQVGSGACGVAIASGERVVVEDIDVDPSFSRCRPILRGANCRAAQATPLLGRSGETVGVLSTYWSRRHRSSERDFRLLDLYARLAAEMIERKQIAEKLRRSEERFRRYFDLGLIGGALTAPDVSCLEVNDELGRILGYEHDELLGRSLIELTHPDDVPADLAQLERVIAGEIHEYTLDKRWIRKDGSVIDTIMATRAVRRAGGAVDYFVSVVQDITARKRAEEALQRLQADLAHVAHVTTMGEMASSIAHEVNQPLAAIMTNANACTRWLAMDPSDLEEAHQAVERIARDAERASEVIARIRRFVQRRGLQRDLLDLAELARETLAMAERDLRRNGVALRIVTAADLPPAFGDRVQLQQVLLNLLKNAVEAMDEVTDRRRTLEVSVDAYGRDALCVAVRDSGLGLDDAQRENVFDAFHTTKPSGMGMGLAISRSIIDAHGGRLWATPNEPHGETFRFTLPLRAAAPDYD